MHAELEALASALNPADSAPPEACPEEALRRAVADAIVVLPAGGFGYRMRALQEGPGPVQKSLLPLPGGETLIDRVVGQYVRSGFRRFVALVNFQGREVETHLAGGARWGVEVRCSYDPDSAGSGRTGAILNALALGILERSGLYVIHNADCQVLECAGDWPRELLGAHVAACARSPIMATLLVVDGCPYPYTGMSLSGGLVREIAMYPFVPIPGHAGITVMSDGALDEMAASGGEGHFERDAFARWAAEGRLAARVISHRHWFAVDDRKAYRQFVRALEAEQAPA